jgi:hypothetical protein
LCCGAVHKACLTQAGCGRSADNRSCRGCADTHCL